LNKAEAHFFGALLLKFVLIEMLNYLINFQPVLLLLGAPFQPDALSALSSLMGYSGTGVNRRLHAHIQAFIGSRAASFKRPL